MLTATLVAIGCRRALAGIASEKSSEPSYRCVNCPRNRWKSLHKVRQQEPTTPASHYLRIVTSPWKKYRHVTPERVHMTSRMSLLFEIALTSVSSTDSCSGSRRAFTLNPTRRVSLCWVHSNRFFSASVNDLPEPSRTPLARHHSCHHPSKLRLPINPSGSPIRPTSSIHCRSESCRCKNPRSLA